MDKIIRFLYIAFIKKEINNSDNLNHFAAKNLSRENYYTARAFAYKYKSSKSNLMLWI